MRCPHLSELPLPPPDNTGWPWTEESTQLPALMPDGSEWPRISIVTPNYNYGHFIEETIRSVLLQGYPNLEYIIMDGGSKDNSVEIIHKYEQWLSFWVSEPDYGQSNAINKGIKKATGKIFNWLNSDDILSLSALSHVASIWNQTNPTILVGSGKVITMEADSDWIPDKSIAPLKLALNCQGGVGMAQPSTFISLEALKSVGGVNENLHYIMDYILYLNLLLCEDLPVQKIVTTERHLSSAKLHEAAKTLSSWNLFEKEIIQTLPSLIERFPISDQKIIRQHLQQLATQVSIRDSAKNPGLSGLFALLKLIFKNHSSIYSRFYMGALKKKLLEVIN
jgi:glycosyltransferase involved in cell wall biosynthesis